MIKYKGPVSTPFVTLICFCISSFTVLDVHGQEDKTNEPNPSKNPSHTVPHETGDQEPSDPNSVDSGVADRSHSLNTENTLSSCQDDIDNDGDNHVDCADQDCQIYVICAPPPPNPQKVKKTVTVVHPPPYSHYPETESLWQCSDGVDNDGDGKVDCHDPRCQLSRYCQAIMYERPEPPKKAPGFFVNLSLGFALPNYNVPTAQTDSAYGTVPFDPDTGSMLGLRLGYLFQKWIGVGLSMNSSRTYASNERENYVDWDNPLEYKYAGAKFHGTLSGFVTLQWPFKRWTPSINLNLGYSATEYVWYIYDGNNLWQDIADYETRGSYYFVGERDVQRTPETGRSRHLLFALEPGVELSVIRRLLNVGVRAWLPVVSTKNFSYDNVGIMLSFTVTPMWREPRVLKPEYSK